MYILIFDKTIRLGSYLGRTVGPFNTHDEACEYFKSALASWQDQDALAGCSIEAIIPKEA